MTNIATLTLNPTLDVAYEVERLYHTRKMRTKSEFYSPGGGGINVARVFVRLGGNARSYYLAGGATGDALDGLLDLHQLVRNRIPIEGHTRVASAVLDLETGKEYRFTPPGPTIKPAEWQACLDQLEHVQCKFLVLSGSLPPGMPGDFYGRVVALMRRRGIPVVLDSSGPGLNGGLGEGGVFLVKPSIGELRQFTGLGLTDPDEIADAAMAIVQSGQAAHVAVTMGHDGALLANSAGQYFLPAAPIEARSAVGAGDSFLSAMLFAITIGWDLSEAFRFGIAAGAAAVIGPGHDLARPSDIQRLYQQVAQIP
ncbi:1-phosphofructokinase family hexose kinase [Novosphingobium album (ex Liu et al. 2023)]|uniref:Phosphofructokinase n=1 Tax=Novosphingobium album (ex Liu et al. 2023) TaxID=3031130 RepID=A0ABT5WWI0_9SPHN|nr:1-phosphofructokinase family hexose kinase [Novosphingobium album (ex Liu et al. 2023)]MDE8654258.1 1-phosphofructokinase family hexose kinase [Novosphingobium album (ex Liu et al. 2023)]